MSHIQNPFWGVHSLECTWSSFRPDTLYVQERGDGGGSGDVRCGQTHLHRLHSSRQKGLKGYSGAAECGKSVVLTWQHCPQVYEAAAETLTPLVLELGGKDPFIVCEDADLEQVRGAVMYSL